MILDSTDSLSIAGGNSLDTKANNDNSERTCFQKGNHNNGQDTEFWSEIKEYPDENSVGMEPDVTPQDWCYLFMHNSRVEPVVSKIKADGRFNVFVHKSVRYTQVKNHAAREVKQSVSGLVFIQGEVRKIKRYLAEELPMLHLVNSCSTRRTAVIPHSVMLPFMRVSAFAPEQIRFLLHPFDKYAALHPVVRITTGILAGLEGCIVRINRDRRLVMQVGDMTVAISGVHKADFEKIRECMDE